MNALDLSQSMPQPPQPNQQGGQQPSAPPGGQGPIPGGQKPAPTHAQTVAALRHFSAFERMYASLQKNVGLGKSDIKSSTIDGVTKLVADRFISPAQAVMLLGSFPTDPKEQRKWISDHYAKDRQAEDAILDHHRAAHKGTQDHDFESQMETSDPNNHMDDLSGMMGAHYAGNGPSGDNAIQAKQQLRGFEAGGRPNVGEDVVVGENGPEVIRMDQPGTVIPNNALFSLGGDRRQSGSFNRMPLDPKWDAMPPSSNIEDRRNEPFYRPLLGQLVHGMTGGLDFERLMEAFRHPMTPMPSLLMRPNDMSSQMKNDFGVDDVGLRGFEAGGRPNVGEDVVVGENGPEVIRMDPNNALFMQSGQYPTPPWRPQMGMNPPRAPLAGYESIDPNELGTMRHREMVQPSAGRGDFTPQHLANMVHAGMGIAGAPGFVRGAMMAAPYLSAEGVAGHFAARAPALAAGGLGAVYAGSPTSAGGPVDGFSWSDPNQTRTDRLAEIEREIEKEATRKTPSAPGTQKARIESLAAEKTKLLGERTAAYDDSFQRWQKEQTRIEEEAAARKRAETSIFDAYPGTRQAMAVAAPVAATLSGYGLGRKYGPWGGMAAGALMGGFEGAASVYGPTEVDYRGLPRTSPTQHQASEDLSDWDWHKRAAAITAMNAGFGAMGGFKGGASRRSVLPMSTYPGAGPNPLSTTASGPMIPAAPANSLALPPSGPSSAIATSSSNALAAPPANKIIERLSDGTILTLHNPGKPGARWYHSGKKTWIKKEEANALRGKGKDED